MSESIISKYEGLKLAGKGTVKLVMTDKRFIFEKKANPLSRKIRSVLTLNGGIIDSVEQEKDFAITIKYRDGDIIRLAKIVPKNPTDSIELIQKIESMIDLFSQSEKAKTFAERQSQLRDIKFITYVLESCSKIWELTDISFTLLRLLGAEDWDSAEMSVKRFNKITKSLVNENSFNLDKSLDSVELAIASRSIEKISDSLADFFNTIGEIVNSDMPPEDEWNQYESSSIPNWSSVAYLLLFALALNHGRLFTEMGIENEKDIASSKIRELSPIMKEKFRNDIFDPDGLGSGKNGINMVVMDRILDEFSAHLRDTLQECLKKASLLT